LPASQIGGLRQNSRTSYFSLNFKPFERGSAAGKTHGRAIPRICFPLAPENQRSAAARARFFSKQEENRRRVFDRSPEPEPHAQVDAAHVDPGDSSEIDDNHAPPAAMQQQIGGLQRLVETFPRFRVSAFVLQRTRRSGFANCRQRTWCADAPTREFPVSLDLFARASRHDMNLRRLHWRPSLSEHRRDCLVHATHQFSRVTPAVRGRRLLAHTRISRFFFGRTEVR